MTSLPAHRALLPDGWGADVDIRIDAAGRIAGLAPGVAGSPSSLWLPGMPNVHSHAFQRALAGRAERAGRGLDSFLTWRERMYALSHLVTPDDIEAIATQLYVEMLEAGYTSVCEFHYLHHGPGGIPHADPAAASRALIRAARSAGIRLTLLPVLYMHAGFGAQPPEPAQAPFIHSVRDYLALLSTLLREQDDTTRIGIAFHSLRAVSPEAMGEVLAWRAGAAPGMPVHIHVAEQLQEVHECEAWSGLRPVEWLLERGIVDERWCLVHATHMTEAETRWLAATGAVVCLCPTTEANLGDGLFPLAGYLAAGGRIAIGSDSQVSVSPVEELRWLEYGQRLQLGQRNVAASATEQHTGARLVRAALAGGAQALGQDAGRLAAGQVADLVELDATHPLLAGGDGEELLDCFVFAGNRPLVTSVLVGGRQVVSKGSHLLAAAAAARFAAVMHRFRQSQ
ncbi:MAG: formimidoylglutamate deiminase [Gammaproteobacteria bacterium]